MLAGNPSAVSDTAAMNAINARARAQFAHPAPVWRAGLPLTRGIDAGGSVLTRHHGSPRGTDAVVGPATRNQHLAEMLDGSPAGTAVGGHVHLRKLRPQGAWARVNPGCIGRDGTGRGAPDLPPARP